MSNQENRLGVISDVHGDPEALSNALDHLEAMGVSRIVCAGDVVGYGPDPDGAVAIVRDRAIPTVRGNHDRWALVRGYGEPDEFGGGMPSRKTLAYLAELEPSVVIEAGGRLIAVVHGTPTSDMEFVTPDRHPGSVLRGYLAVLGVDVLIGGHTHRPMWSLNDLGLVVNPGSLVTRGRVESSRTFAVVDLTSLAARFYRVDSGKQVEVAAWPSLPSTRRDSARTTA